MKKYVYHSPLGPLILIARNGYLVYCNWDEPDCQNKLKAIENTGKDEVNTENDIEIIDLTIRMLDKYFVGQRVSFDIPLQFQGSDFRKNVWREMQKIKYGEKLSYKELSERCNCRSGIRAVAGACGANPLAIIVPCHRVISANGRLGGYTGGLDKKIKLLELESNNLIIKK